MKTRMVRLMTAATALLVLGALGCGGGAETAAPTAPAEAPAAAEKPAAVEKPAETQPAAAADSGGVEADGEDAPVDPAASAAAAGNAEGAAAYASFCVSCHGPSGAGDGPVGAALNPKPANFAAADFWNDKRTDAYLTTVIRDGGPAVGLSPLMAPWGSVLDEAKIKAVIEHLKSLKKG